MASWQTHSLPFGFLLSRSVLPPIGPKRNPSRTFASGPLQLSLGPGHQLGTCPFSRYRSYPDHASLHRQRRYAPRLPSTRRYRNLRSRSRHSLDHSGSAQTALHQPSRLVASLRSLRFSVRALSLRLCENRSNPVLPPSISTTGRELRSIIAHAAPLELYGLFNALYGFQRMRRTPACSFTSLSPHRASRFRHCVCRNAERRHVELLLRRPRKALLSQSPSACSVSHAARSTKATPRSRVESFDLAIESSPPTPQAAMASTCRHCIQDCDLGNISLSKHSLSDQPPSKPRFAHPTATISPHLERLSLDSGVPL